MTTNKIKSLTPQMEALLPVYRDRWLSLGLSTDRMDKDRAREAASECYRSAGLTPPETFLYAKSPQDARRILQEMGVKPDVIGASTHFNNHEAGSLGFYQFYRSEMGLKGMEPIDPLIRLGMECGWVNFLDEVCVLQERPIHIRFDDQQRAHSETGLAIEYEDGFGAYCWHGVRVPSEWYTEGPPSPADALRWENLEQRRAACELIGWATILKELDAVTIDKDDDPMIGELLRVVIPDVGEEQFLRVLCGTGREFALPVPPDVETALAANAWTYDIDGDTLRKLEVRT